MLKNLVMDELEEGLLLAIEKSIQKVRI